MAADFRDFGLLTGRKCTIFVCDFSAACLNEECLSVHRISGSSDDSNDIRFATPGLFLADAIRIPAKKKLY
jgi:hypothetical protein